MPLFSWQDNLYYQPGIRKNGFQLKLGPSLLLPKMYQVAEALSGGWEVDSSEAQNVGLQVGVGFLGRTHNAVANIDAKRLPDPTHITTFKSKEPVIVHYLSSSKRKTTNDPPKKGMKICEWYRKQRALRALKKSRQADLKRQRKLHQDQARQEREEEVYNVLLQREIELLQAEQKVRGQQSIIDSYYSPSGTKAPEKSRPEKPQYSEAVKTKPVHSRTGNTKPVHSRTIKETPVDSRTVKEKPVHTRTVKEKPVHNRTVKEKPIEMKRKKTKGFKRKAIEVKPEYESRQVTTGKFKVHQCRQPFLERCKNCLYRTCCKLYCCLTIFIIMIGVIIFAF